jgi:hypothetical protein
MSNIAPIETKYAGYRFRSRLEARWAVFLDALGIRWEYEKEGYELPSGRYLPDFWLPNPGVWLEIKGEAPNDIEFAKLEDLCERTGHNGIIWSGLPQIPAVMTTHGYVYCSGYEEPCPCCLTEPSRSLHGLEVWGSDCFGPGSVFVVPGTQGSLSGAIEAAKQARFVRGLW